MSLKGISDENNREEQEIMQELFQCIDRRQSVLFNAGAGAGKTYALVQCLKYIVSSYGEELKSHNQKIICITYTNVAANHIKECVGNSELIKVSTIHERIWSVIKKHQTELVKLHTRKLKEQNQQMKQEIMSNPDFSFFQQLGSEEQNKFCKTMMGCKEKFQQAYGMSATEFKTRMQLELVEIPININSVTKFKKLVGKIYKINRYQECLEKIQKKTKGYNFVDYNARYNQDRLERMRISHDTLLEYGIRMVEEYPMLRQIIIDQYPYILIDEYQDTAENVVKIMNMLDIAGNEIGHNIFVAYYGDAVQSIYEGGVGKRITDLHKNLVRINKRFNRRSYDEIICVANKVRNDEICQKSIFEKCTGGSVKFYEGEISAVENFIEDCAKELKADVENPIHCFFTTNKLVAQYSKFEQLYLAIQGAEIYKGSNYGQLNSELMSQDVTKLGRVPAFLYRLMQLYTGVRQESTPLTDILIKEEWRELDIKGLRSLINLLKKGEGKTLDSLLKSIFEIYQKESNSEFQQIIDMICDLDGPASYEGVLMYIRESLFPREEDEDKVTNSVHALLKVETSELENWYWYIKNIEVKDKIFHTYHGTKGLEYRNVVIIMEKGFGINKGYFENFFLNYDNSCNLKEKEKSDFEMARNLLYVAVTRAIQNLRVFYTDDLGAIGGVAEKIFGKIEEYPQKEEKCSIED